MGGGGPRAGRPVRRGQGSKTKEMGERVCVCSVEDYWELLLLEVGLWCQSVASLGTQEGGVQRGGWVGGGG